MLRKHGYAKKLYYRTKHTKRIAGALWLFTQEKNNFPDNETLNQELSRWGLEILQNSDIGEKLPIQEKNSDSEKKCLYGKNPSNMGEPMYDNDNGCRRSTDKSEKIPIYSTHFTDPIYGKNSDSEKKCLYGKNSPDMGSPIYINNNIKKEKNKNIIITTTTMSDKKLNPENCNLQSSEFVTTSQGLNPKSQPITPSKFEKFWSRYPKKIDRGKCQTIWERMCNKKPSERPTWGTIINALEAQKKSERWSDPKFIPHPSTWLNQKRWLDDPAEMKLYHFDEPKEKFPSNPRRNYFSDRPNTGGYPRTTSFGTGWSGYYDQPEIRAKLEGIVMKPKF